MRAAAFALVLALCACAAPAPRDESRAATPYATGVTIGGSMGAFWGQTR